LTMHKLTFEICLGRGHFLAGGNELDFAFLTRIS